MPELARTGRHPDSVTGSLVGGPPAPSHQPQVVHMIQNFIALTADPEGQAARASMRISEQTQGLLDAVWDQLTKI